MSLGETCSHGKTWKQDCIECSIIWNEERYQYAKEMLARYEKRLQELYKEKSNELSTR